MILDSLLHELEQLMLFFMWELEKLIPSAPAPWMDVAIASVQAVLAHLEEFWAWVPIEWFVPVVGFVMSVKLAALIARTIITVWDLGRGSGA